MIASNLANFPTLLESMMWIKNFSLADGQLVGTIFCHLNSTFGIL